MIVRGMVGDLAVVKVIAIDGGERGKKSARLDDSVSRRVEHLAVAGKTIKDGREDGREEGEQWDRYLSTAAYKIQRINVQISGRCIVPTVCSLPFRLS